MQLKASLVAAIACATVMSQAAVAGPLSCSAGYTHATITDGSAATVNLSAIKQIGQLCLKMANDKGKVVFDDCGALIGTVTSTYGAGNPTSLSHTAVFELFESFKTVNDTPFLGELVDPSDPAQCAFKVGERFTELKWGTGIFKGGALNVEAVGVVSFCPSQNKNTFVLSGDACLKLKR
jgi:hypothetical protein